MNSYDQIRLLLHIQNEYDKTPLLSLPRSCAGYVQVPRPLAVGADSQLWYIKYKSPRTCIFTNDKSSGQMHNRTHKNIK